MKQYCEKTKNALWNATWRGEKVDFLKKTVVTLFQDNAQPNTAYVSSRC